MYLSISVIGKRGKWQLILNCSILELKCDDIYIL